MSLSLSSYLFLAHSLQIESLLIIPGGKEAHPGFEEAGIALCTLSGGSGVRVCNGAERRGWATQRESQGGPWPVRELWRTAQGSTLLQTSPLTLNRTRGTQSLW